MIEGSVIFLVNYFPLAQCRPSDELVAHMVFHMQQRTPTAVLALKSCDAWNAKSIQNCLALDTLEANEHIVSMT
jgi:hypothetical protein